MWQNCDMPIAQLYRCDMTVMTINWHFVHVAVTLYRTQWALGGELPLYHLPAFLLWIVPHWATDYKTLCCDWLLYNHLLLLGPCGPGVILHDMQIEPCFGLIYKNVYFVGWGIILSSPPDIYWRILTSRWRIYIFNEYSRNIVKSSSQMFHQFWSYLHSHGLNFSPFTKCLLYFHRLSFNVNCVSQSNSVLTQSSV